MILWTALSWVMSGVALAGTVLNAERNVYGFVFWLVSNLYMTIRFFYIGEYAQAVLFFVYTALAIRGIISWTQKERRAKAPKDLSLLLKKIQKQADEWKAERRKEAEKIAEKELENKKL
jgi:nicotinamide riboside transporter PnuC